MLGMCSSEGRVGEQEGAEEENAQAVRRLQKLVKNKKGIFFALSNALLQQSEATKVDDDNKNVFSVLQEGIEFVCSVAKKFVAWLFSFFRTQRFRRLKFKRATWMKRLSACRPSRPR